MLEIFKIWICQILDFLRAKVTSPHRKRAAKHGGDAEFEDNEAEAGSTKKEVNE